MFNSIFADLGGGAGAGPVSAQAGTGASLGFGGTDKSDTHPLVPTSTNGFAWGVWLGVGAFALLIFVRHSLPA